MPRKIWQNACNFPLFFTTTTNFFPFEFCLISADWVYDSFFPFFYFFPFVASRRRKSHCREVFPFCNRVLSPSGISELVGRSVDSAFPPSEGEKERQLFLLLRHRKKKISRHLTPTPDFLCKTLENGVKKSFSACSFVLLHLRRKANGIDIRIEG